MNPLHFIQQKSPFLLIFFGFLSFNLSSQNCAGVDFTYKIIDNTVVFIGESKIDVTEWSWSFGDNTGDNGRIVKHKYEKEGEYEVCVKFNASKECSGIVCKKVKYEADVNECGLSADYSSKIDGRTVIFSGASNDDQATYLWSVTGQNIQYSGKEVKIIFDREGIFEVCLTVINKDETCKIRVCKKVEVGNICSAEVDFIYEASGNIIKLLARSNAGENVKYVWSFGNGATADGKSIRYKYDKPGTYEICLKIIIAGVSNTNETCTKTVCKKVTINELEPICNIKADFDIKTNGLTAFFSATSSEPEATYNWYVVGLQGQYTGKEVKIPFLKDGIYEVCMIVVNRAQTCKVQICKKVEVKSLSED